MKKIWPILFSLLLLVACGSKTQTSQTKISFSSGSSSMLGSGPQMNGGIVVIGHRLDDSEKFQIGLVNASDEKFLDLKKGQWEFAAIGWEGGVGGLFTGVNRCAYSGIINLTANDTAINFNLDFATCASIPNHGAVVSHPDFMLTNNQFKFMAIHSCESLTMTSDPTVAVSCAAKGLTGSFKLVTPGVMSIQGGKNPLPSLESGCFTPLDANGLTKLPVGNFINGKKENLIESMVMAFQSSDCSGKPIAYDFNDSMYMGINQINLKARANTDASPYTTLFLEHNATTVSANIGFSPFGYGKDGDVTTIPTPSVNEFGNIKEIDGTPATIKLAGSGSSGINAFDEVMWYVTSEATSGTSCGGGFLAGMFGFAQVKSKASSYPDTVLTLDKSIREYVLSGPPPAPTLLTTPTPANLAANFCSMQVVRVPHYRNVSILSSLTTTGYLYDANTDHFGGIFPFKVSNELNISGTLTIDSTGKGSNTATVSACSGSDGKRCLKMGGGSGGGGGIILGWINQINLSASGANLAVKSNGNTGANGGFVDLKVSKIISGFGATAITEDVTQGPGGTAGAAHFQYCDNPNYVSLPVGNLQGCNF